MSVVLQFGRWLLIIGLVLGYAFLAHYTNTATGPKTAGLGLLVALTPIMLVALSMAWHARRRAAMLALFCLACVGLFAAWGSLRQHFGLIYWLEHAGSQLILALAFARTLRAGREPMCSYFARMVHGALVPAMEHYTRQLTAAWVVFFGTMAAVSTLLFVVAPIQAWSLFANFFTGPLICTMFVAEYAVRRRLLPNIDHAHILDGIKAFWKQPAR